MTKNNQLVLLLTYTSYQGTVDRDSIETWCLRVVLCQLDAASLEREAAWTMLEQAMYCRSARQRADEYSETHQAKL